MLHESDEMKQEIFLNCKKKKKGHRCQSIVSGPSGNPALPSLPEFKIAIRAMIRLLLI